MTDEQEAYAKMLLGSDCELNLRIQSARRIERAERHEAAADDLETKASWQRAAANECRHMADFYDNAAHRQRMEDLEMERRCRAGHFDGVGAAELMRRAVGVAPA